MLTKNLNLMVGFVPLPTLRFTAIKLSIGIQTFRFGSV
jgi:hypothetical protein